MCGSTEEYYQYDALDRMYRYYNSADGDSASYQYNTDNQVVKAGSTDLYWDGSRITYEQTGSSGIPYVLGLSVEGISGSNSKSYSAEGNGDVGDDVCDAYGNIIEDNDQSGNYGYRGYFMDKNSGMYMLGSRFYDPNARQFTQQDTYHGDNYAMNLYGYCSGDPINYTDPTGHTQYEYGARPVVGNGEIISRDQWGYVEDPGKNIRDVFWYYETGEDQYIYWDYALVPDNLKDAARAGLGGFYEQFVKEGSKFSSTVNIGNNPIMNSDPSGYLTLSTFWTGLSLDIILTLVCPAFSGAYDVIGLALKSFASRNGMKLVSERLLTSVVPKVIGLFSRFFTLIRTAIWRATGAVIGNSATSLISGLGGKITSELGGKNATEAYNFISMFFSAGSFVAGMFDWGDGNLDGKICY